jgi:hypothetical protein
VESLLLRAIRWGALIPSAVSTPLPPEAVKRRFLMRRRKREKYSTTVLMKMASALLVCAESSLLIDIVDRPSTDRSFSWLFR